MATELFANNISFRLAAGCAAGDTTLVLDGTVPTALRAAGGQWRALISDSFGTEVVIVPGGQAGPTVTGVTRAAEPVNGVQAATSHSQGTFVTHVFTAGTMTGIVLVTSPDTGANAASRIAVAHEAPLNVEWPEYGASPSNTAAQNSTALAAAVNALPASGGTILLPRSYTYDTGLVLDDQRCATLQGVGGKSSGASCATDLTYTGTGVALSCRSTSGTTLRDFALDAPNATSTIIDFSHSASASDAAYMMLENLRLSASSACPRLLELDKAIIGRFVSVHFGSSTRAVRGWAAGSYSNGHIFSGCAFGGSTNHPIDSPGQGWAFDGCTFEALSGGTAGGVQMNRAANGLNVHGCWFGDATVATGQWVDIEAASSGVSIRGNYFGGGAAVDGVLVAVGCKGVEVVANKMDATRYGVNIQAAATCDGLMIMNDDSNCVTSGVNLGATPTRGIVMDGKAATFGSYGMTVH